MAGLPSSPVGSSRDAARPRAGSCQTLPTPCRGGPPGLLRAAWRARRRRSRARCAALQNPRRQWCCFPCEALVAAVEEAVRGAPRSPKHLRGSADLFSRLGVRHENPMRRLASEAPLAELSGQTVGLLRKDFKTKQTIIITVSEGGDEGDKEGDK